MSKLLIIGYIWPEPHRTAAGYRMLQIIDLFLSQHYEVTLCCAARIKPTSSEALESRGIPMIPIQLNNDDFDQLLQELQPDIVIYDRFLVEEQYGWRVRKVLPAALQILDTEDLHFLRDARKNHIENQISLIQSFKSELAIREISSIRRVDFSLIISSIEMEFLMNQYQMESSRIFHLPFLIDENDILDRCNKSVPFEERQGFCTIGNLRHAPNLDSVRQLKTAIWPQIRSELPEAQLFIYGSNAPQEVLEMHDPKTGFLVKGHVPSVDKALQKHRLLLAPLRYGAGLKGKIFDAMKNGIPSIMTNIAAEGMFGEHPAPGIIHDEPINFAQSAIVLYSDQKRWNEYANNGFKILKEIYKESAFAKALFQHIEQHRDKVYKSRTFDEQMMIYHADAHFKFMSYWINAKKGADSKL
ncbi:glycosyltransferase [Nonlabens antarcticus]|uniref:glycosyltransferase n=1 Tax=Nonlabens antarcticus TaxID=392714 RepID=UPI001890C15F|nr:glycosyltransferase [Nonlabens antarcticus]